MGIRGRRKGEINPKPIRKEMVFDGWFGLIHISDSEDNSNQKTGKKLKLLKAVLKPLKG